MKNSLEPFQKFILKNKKALGAASVQPAARHGVVRSDLIGNVHIDIAPTGAINSPSKTRKLWTLPVSPNLLRGMVSYAVIWPACSVVQEYLAEGTPITEADWMRAARFSFFGAFLMSPVFYNWMRLTNRFFPKKNLATAIKRAALEQVSYSPLAMAYFFFGMSLLEMNSVHTAVAEVKEKFWPTYKLGVIFWPTAQTLNFYFIPERNRIIFVSLASFVWTVFLCHMKSKSLVDP